MRAERMTLRAKHLQKEKQFLEALRGAKSLVLALEKRVQELEMELAQYKEKESASLIVTPSMQQLASMGPLR